MLAYSVNVFRVLWHNAFKLSRILLMTHNTASTSSKEIVNPHKDRHSSFFFCRFRFRVLYFNFRQFRWFYPQLQMTQQKLPSLTTLIIFTKVILVRHKAEWGQEGPVAPNLPNKEGFPLLKMSDKLIMIQGRIWEMLDCSTASFQVGTACYPSKSAFKILTFTCTWTLNSNANGNCTTTPATKQDTVRS